MKLGSYKINGAHQRPMDLLCLEELLSSDDEPAAKRPCVETEASKFNRITEYKVGALKESYPTTSSKAYSLYCRMGCKLLIPSIAKVVFWGERRSLPKVSSGQK